MSEYTATVKWARAAGEVYTDNKYSRSHLWLFDGGAEIAASSSPKVVPLPWSVEAKVDPEEAFAAAGSWTVDEYNDDAVGIMAIDSHGKLSMTTVTLRPLVTFSGAKRPTPPDIAELHQRSHAACFIANSVKTRIVIDPVLPVSR